MVMLLLQQIGRATATRRSFSARAAGLGSIFARRGKSALVPPPAPPAASFSRLYSNGASGNIEDEPFFVFFCKLTFKYGATLGLIYGVFDWVDYGGYKAAAAEWDKLKAEEIKERLALEQVVEELNK